MLPADVVSSSLSQVYCQQLLSDEAESVAVKEKIKIKSEELETLDTLTCHDLALGNCFIHINEFFIWYIFNHNFLNL